MALALAQKNEAQLLELQEEWKQFRQSRDEVDRRTEERFEKLFKLLNDGFGKSKGKLMEKEKRIDSGLPSNTRTPLETVTKAKTSTHRTSIDPIAKSIKLLNEGKSSCALIFADSYVNVSSKNGIGSVRNKWGLLQAVPKDQKNEKNSDFMVSSACFASTGGIPIFFEDSSSGYRKTMEKGKISDGLMLVLEFGFLLKVESGINNRVSVREAIYAYQGNGGRSVNFDNIIDVYIVLDSVNVQRATRWLFDKGKGCTSENMAKFSAEGVGIIGQASCTTLLGELSEYCKLLAVLKTELLNMAVILANCFSSRRLSVWVAAHTITMGLMAISIDRCMALKGGAMADASHNHATKLSCIGAASYRGNMGIKFDIRIACGTLDWSFFIMTLSLQAFGFCATFVSWIQVLLESAKLSTIINGEIVGLFDECKKGVPQSEPLPSFLICFVEDVFIRGISRLAQDQLTTQITSSPGANSSTHRLYANAMLVFCMGIILLLKKSMHLFQLYGEESGQIHSNKNCQVFQRSLWKKTLESKKKFQQVSLCRFSSVYAPKIPPFDYEPKKYNGPFAGIVTVSYGHCHLEIVNVVVEPSNLLLHATTIYLHPAITDFAEALASKMPGNLKVVYFVNFGTEANELAMLMVRLYTGNLGMSALRNAYHGGSAGTMGLTALNTWKYPIPQGEIHHVVNPDPYRGIFGSEANSYGEDVEDHINYGSSGRVAGFIA